MTSEHGDIFQTCATLYQLSKLRTVWINALHSIMKRHSISEATFPLQTMDLPLLEHAALSPHRFLSLLEKSNGTSIRPFAIRVLSPRLTNTEKEKYGIFDNDGLYDIYVESTGRYLASLSAYESFTLFTIWDLGLCSKDAIKPLVRYLEPASPTLYLDGFSPGPQGSNVFYLFSTQDSSLVAP